MKYLLLLFGLSLSLGLSAQLTDSTSAKSLPASYIEESVSPNFKMIHIPGGTFKMGSSKGQQNFHSNEELPVHKVTLSGFYMGEAEVSVGEFKAFIQATGYKTDAEKEGYSRVQEFGVMRNAKFVTWRNNVTGKRLQTDNHPVIHLSWNDAMAYIDWLNTKSTRHYRLPTEAEWEYAAREGGKDVLFGNGKRILDPEEANFNGDPLYYGNDYVSGFISEQTMATKTFNPNTFGLYNMAGNVWEWCGDWFGLYTENDSTNPTGPNTGTNRIIRGGAWMTSAGFCRTTFRYYVPSNDRSCAIGFRLVASE